MGYHKDGQEAQCCPLCNPGVHSPQVVEEALDWAHLCQKVVGEVLERLPSDVLIGELQRRGYVFHLLELARECAGPDWGIDLERCSPLMAGIEAAVNEAEAYTRETACLLMALNRLLGP